MPMLDIPEVAFAGRSNVGKSSLLNALVNRKKLAHTSNTPGRTRLINFFSLINTLMLVDLPGYGYAKASKKEKNSWGQFITEYLKLRKQLQIVFILIDSRRGIKEVDEQLMDFLDNIGVSYQIILTKYDKLKKIEQEEVRNDTHEKIKNKPAAYPEIIITSSAKKIGIEELQKRIMELV